MSRLRLLVGQPRLCDGINDIHLPLRYGSSYGSAPMCNSYVLHIVARIPVMSRKAGEVSYVWQTLTRHRKSDMARDLKIEGNIVYFLGSSRCQACQWGNNKCLVQRGEERCFLCSEIKRECVYERSITVRGPHHSFGWNTLLLRPDTIPLSWKDLDSDSYIAHFPSYLSVACLVLT